MGNMNRAQRRRQERELARYQAPDAPVVAGVFSELGVHDIGSMAALPPKVPGKHRWMATCAYVLTEEMVRNEIAHQAGDSKLMTILDHETRFAFGIGCWDCEKPFPEASPDTVCPADGDD